MNFAGEVTPEKVRLWHEALNDVTDEALSAAVPRLIREHAGAFIPPVGLVREFAGANAKPVVDVEAMRRRIATLGSYNPTVGWSAPRTDVVRRELGEAVGDAYASVGGERLFGQGTTREIALREFGDVIQQAVAARGVQALSPYVGATVPVLPQVKRLVAEKSL